MSKKPPKAAAQLNSKIPKPDFSKIARENVSFSFKYLDLKSNSKFSIDEWQALGDWSGADAAAYLTALLERLKNVSSLSVNDFLHSRSPALRSHKIDWDSTSEVDGFTSLNEHLRDQEARQFSVSSNEYGRVHGFLLDNCFCVVWLDPFHKLYP